MRARRAEVDLAAIAHNVGVVRGWWPGAPHRRRRCSGVVKADAYGPGAALVARAMQAAGVAGFCVALVEEGPRCATPG